MRRHTTATAADEKVGQQEQIKRLEKLANLYDQLHAKLDELEAKIEQSPTLAKAPNKPK